MSSSSLRFRSLQQFYQSSGVFHRTTLGICIAFVFASRCALTLDTLRFLSSLFACRCAPRGGGWLPEPRSTSFSSCRCCSAGHGHFVASVGSLAIVDIVGRAKAVVQAVMHACAGGDNVFLKPAGEKIRC